MTEQRELPATGMVAGRPMSDAATRGFVHGTARDRGFEQVSRFLLLIGAERSAPVLARLTEREVVCIAREVAALGSIEPREQRRTMEEFGYPLPPGSATTGGGAAAAHRLLRAAFAEERAAALLQAALHVADGEAPLITSAPPGTSSAAQAALHVADSEAPLITPAPPGTSSAAHPALHDAEHEAAAPATAPATGTAEQSRSNAP